MADPLRDQDTTAADSPGRESRIEELLLAGLDHYFSGQHELAISVWTRVLFLDRSHARRRAYIRGARTASARAAPAPSASARVTSSSRPAPPPSIAATPKTRAGC